MKNRMRFIAGSLAAAGLIFGGAALSVAADTGIMKETAPGTIMGIAKNKISYTCPPVIKLKTQQTAAVPVKMQTSDFGSAGADWLEMTFSLWTVVYNDVTKSTFIASEYCLTSPPQNKIKTCRNIFLANPNGPWDCKPAGNTLNCTEK